MEGLYMACLIGGVVYALISVIFGDLLDGIFDFLSLDFLQPMTLVGGITVFGGAGVMLSRYTSLGAWPVGLISLLIAIVAGIAVFFLYVKPMENSENSIGFTMQSLAGALGDVTVPIPAEGYGEVLVKVGAGHTNQIAASFDNKEIPSSARVVVVEVKDSVLYVSEIDLNV